MKELTPCPGQHLNEHGVQKIYCLQKFYERFKSGNAGNFCGIGMEVCEQLSKRKGDMCSLQEVRWRGQGTCFVGVKGRRYKLWWSGNMMKWEVLKF